MKRILAVLLLVSGAASALPALDPLVCASGLIANCPHASSTTSATSLSVTLTNGSSNPVLMVALTQTAASTSGGSVNCGGPPIVSDGSVVLVYATNYENNGSGTATCAAYGYSTTAITAGATVKTGSGTFGGSPVDSSLTVLVFSGRAGIGRFASVNSGTSMIVTLGSISQDSLWIGAFANRLWDGTAVSPNAGTTILSDVPHSGNSADLFVGYTQAISGSNSIGASDGTINASHWSVAALEIVNPAVNVIPDYLACSPFRTGGNPSLLGCINVNGTTATSITTSLITTAVASELICAVSAEQGVGTYTTTVTDSGTSLAIPWTRIGTPCRNGADNDAEVWCAVTSATTNAHVTWTFSGGTSVASSIGYVVPLMVGYHVTLPTNTVCSTGVSGAPTLTITPNQAGSLIVEDIFKNNTTGVTGTTAPWIGFVQEQPGGGSAVWGGGAWTVGTAPETIGMSLPTATLWSAIGVELPLNAPSSSPGWVNWW